MNPSLPSPLPRSDRKLLRFVCRFVPFNQQEEWIRSWAAELWCCHHAPCDVRTRTLFFGVLQDALWLRGEQVRQAVSGTAVLCLFALLILIGVSSLPALSHSGRWGGLGFWLMRQGPRFSCESVLIAFVSYATAPFQVGGIATRRQVWLKARLFHWARTFLVLVLAFNLSADLSYPLRTLVPLTAEFLQSMSFAFLALLGLRWSLQDDIARCRQCLRSLAAPERVGRPSHNFLEWNGTELLCSHGHGLLSVPELETSWCRASAWVAHNPPLSTSEGISH